jgi:hypothetical protein
MRRLRCSLLILATLSLASAKVLAQGSEQPKAPESPQAELQALQLERPSFTAEQEAWISRAFQAVARAAAKAAVDEAVPKAVQAAVAEERGKAAKAQSLADQWKAEAELERGKADRAFGRGAVIGSASTAAVAILARMAFK